MINCGLCTNTVTIIWKKCHFPGPQTEEIVCQTHFILQVQCCIIYLLSELQYSYFVNLLTMIRTLLPQISAPLALYFMRDDVVNMFPQRCTTRKCKITRKCKTTRKCNKITRKCKNLLTRKCKNFTRKCKRNFYP